MKIKKLTLKIVIVMGYMLFIYLFSQFKFPDPSGGDPSSPKISIFPFLHIGEFGLLTVLLMWAFYPKIKWYFLTLVSVGYGISDEIHQYFIPYRWFDYKDIIHDTVGAILGVLVFFMLVLIYVYTYSKIRGFKKL